MIAVDTSTLVAFLAGDPGRDVDALDAALAQSQALLPPVVVTETLSAANAPPRLRELLAALPMLVLTEGYWDRAGALRRRVLAKGHKAALADTLIAQACIDHEVALLTRDADFRQFARVGGLALA